MRKATFRLIGLSVAVLTAISTATAVNAYPPGQEIALSVSKDMMKPNSSFTMKVTRATPSSRFNYKVGSSKSRTKTSNQSGSSIFMAFGPSTPGIYKATVTDTTNLTKDSVTLYVPSIWVPTKLTPGGRFSISLKYAKNGAPVSIKLGNGKTIYSKIVNHALRVTLTAPTAAGTYPVRVTAGSLTYVIQAEVKQ